jgi:ComF family protein
MRISFYNKLRDIFYQLLYPRSCVECDEIITSPADSDTPFCLNCFAKVRRITGPTCFICNVPFVSAAATSHSPEQQCADCREDPTSFEKAITPFFYDPPLSTAICKFKYEKQTYLAHFFVRLTVERLAHLNVDRVMAVPLHPNRLRHREFNQSLLLAKGIAETLSIPLSIDALIRTRETVPQVGLSKKEREENIKGAFGVARPNEVLDERILLVDDVYTTGATLKEGARVLMQEGAKAVIAFAPARMVLH